MKEIIKAGEKFGRLTAIKFISKDNHGSQKWSFQCDCGNIKIINVNNVKRGKSMSCGCQSIKSATVHGMSKFNEYRIWLGMKQRCNNKNRKDYNLYGGRGIKICKRWKNFGNFYIDMGERPAGKSLDRIDNKKGYFKENCRWSTQKEQNNNQRSNHLIKYKNKIKTISQWAEKININYSTLWYRINIHKWSIKRALTSNLNT